MGSLAINPFLTTTADTPIKLANSWAIALCLPGSDDDQHDPTGN